MISGRQLVRAGQIFTQNAFRAKKSVRFVNSGRLVASVAGGGCALIAGSLWLWNKDENTPIKSWLPTMVEAATAAKPQPNVISQPKTQAVYITIHLNEDADVKKFAKFLSHLQKHVDKVSPPDLRDEFDEVTAGIGFSPKLYAKLGGQEAPKSFDYKHRKGPGGEMPATGGDIFIHAKSDNYSKLFELAQEIYKGLPKGSVKKFEDIYGFTYRNGRDLSGFIDGTENPADDDSRVKVAIGKNNGGSYCITQKWVHDMDLVYTEKDSVLEGYIGRLRSDSTELKKKPATSHVARMTSGPEFGAKKPVEIVRQSQPYGTAGKEAGLFFIAYAADPKNFDYMLDRMVGTTEDGLTDDTMKITKPVTGNYWYFPSEEELKKFGDGAGSGWFK